MSQDSNEPITTTTDAIVGPPDGAGRAAATAAPVPQRPEGIPERFWDADAGSLKAKALLEAHRELEGRLGALAGIEGAPDDPMRARLLELLGRPAGPEGYGPPP
jgi:hypothetical protein